MLGGRTLSMMTMGSALDGRALGTSRRLFAGAAVLVLFGALFVLPLCAALALCTMPCCHHENSPSGSLVSGAKTGCETTCGVRAAETTQTTVAAVAPQAGTPRTPPVAVAQLPVLPAGVTVLAPDAHSTHRGADASLVVLNSVFRI